MYAFVGLRTEELRTPPPLRRLGDALDELLSLAKPPESLTLPDEARAAVMGWIEGWRKDVIEFATFEEIREQGRYAELCQHVRNYTEWLQAGIDNGHAMHCDVFIALMNTTLDEFAVRSKNSVGSWMRVQAFTKRTGFASDQPAYELGRDSDKAASLMLMLKEQPLESALTRVASASLRALRKDANILSRALPYATKQLEKWLNTEVDTMRRCSDQQLEDKVWLYGMLDLLGRLEHACEHNPSAQTRLLDHWRFSALLERNPCQRANPHAQRTYADYLKGRAFWAGPVPPEMPNAIRPKVPERAPVPDIPPSFDPQPRRKLWWIGPLHKPRVFSRRRIVHAQGSPRSAMYQDCHGRSPIPTRTTVRL